MRANTSFTVEVKSRLWNSTLVEDYANVDRVEIVSKASVIVDPVYTQEVRFKTIIHALCRSIKGLEKYSVIVTGT